MPEEDLDHPFLLVSYRVARPTETNAALLATLASLAPLNRPFNITYAMRLLNAQLNRVVDLGDPGKRAARSEASADRMNLEPFDARR